MLHDDACGVALGVVNARLELLAVVGRADAYARTEVGRLDDDGIAQACLDLFDERVALSVPLLVGEPHIVDHGYVVGTEYHLHGDLIHAVCRRKHVATCIRYADCLKHALKYAVLHVGAVEHGDHHIKLCHRLDGRRGEEPLGVGGVKIVVAVDGAHVDLGTLFEQFGYVAVVLYVEQRLAGVPVSLFGNIDRGNVILVAVDRGHGLRSRNH